MLRSAQTYNMSSASSQRLLITQAATSLYVPAQTISPSPQKSHKIVIEVALKSTQKHFNPKRECFVLTYQQPA